MHIVYYYAIFAISLLCAAIYAYIWHKHFNVCFTMIFTFVPLCNLGYLLVATSDTLGEAFMAVKIVYSSCFLALFIMLAILDLCNIRLKKWMVTSFFLISTIVYASTITIGQTGIFYKSGRFVRENGYSTVVDKSYGPMHTVFIVMIILYFLIPLSAMVYSMLKKKDVSNKIVSLLILSEAICFISYFAGKKITFNFDPIPLSYVIAQVIFLIIIRKISLYNVTDTGIDSIEMSGEIGFVSFDNKLNYLGGSDIALIVFPELMKVKVDTPASKDEKAYKEVVSKIEAFIENPDNNSFTRVWGSEIYRVTINRLYNAHKCKGYQLLIRNDTKEQNYIQLINSFNESLEKEVDLKTRRIVEMHDNLILSMATVVESRDNSTGGHIRRTSDVVKILIDEIKKDNVFNLSDTFCNNLIKAAPMHDLGKIAVDDAILRKPGRFTPEEYMEMKKHAAEGGRIVHEILKNTDDYDFHILAENVAHYHHERWDGSGYPEGLIGEEIPIEARIMAIADVYDALVSKRVYKERMSFEEANKIIMEGMGKHFDKRLERYYVAARPRLEEYYTINA